jgi:xanthine dehydrogenase iron-sulfur cluster and FAD-binding subunit A
MWHGSVWRLHGARKWRARSVVPDPAFLYFRQKLRHDRRAFRERLRSLSKAWLEEDVSQCGYCQAGMIMEAAALIRKKPKIDNDDIDSNLSGHVCRCGTYQRVRRAILRAARETQAK